ncbi:MAG: HD domain-containing protein [Desulfobulbaceae bacterium]|nr:HD domain-containing protein [Desulfobulbaceae bacterium]
MGKNTFVDGLSEGDRFDDLFLVKSVKLGETRAGKPYLVLSVMDKSGDVSGPVWDNAEQLHQVCKVGTVVRCRGMVQLYRDNKQLKFDGIEPVAEGDFDLGDFLPASTRCREEMARDLEKIIRTVKNPFLKKMLNHFFKKSDWWPHFQEAPAAKGIHHAYIGGLLEHSLSVATVADFIANHYEGVDRSLLISGALLHDIGKLEELRLDNGVIDYTVRGRLKGHLVIGSEMVGHVAGKIRDFPENLLEHLQHLILSHHGRLEFGSPTLPMTVEAFVLNLVDDLDAKMNMIEQLRRKLDSEELGWTEYQRVLERYLYLGGFAKTNDVDERKVSGSHQPTLF